MKTFVTICFASLVGLVLLPSPCRAQVPYDLSQAVEYKTVWTKDVGGEFFPIAFVPNVCGQDGYDVLTGVVVGRGRFTWRTQPALDTFSIDGSLAVLPLPIDVDGVPPLEYLNSSGHLLRCSGAGENPFPLAAFDTVAGCAEEPELSVDIDGDGFLDVITDIGGGELTARVVMGGPQAGEGCERVFPIPLVKNRSLSNWTAVFYRSSTGVWRTIQVERDASSYNTWLMIYDVTISRVGGKPMATFTKRDSIRGTAAFLDEGTFGSAAVLVDTNAHKDWLLVNHKLNVTPGTIAVERFDVTEGRLVATGEQVTGYIFLESFNKNLGHQLGTTKPVIAIVTPTGYVFCYGDNIRQPFAKADFANQFSNWAVINDQTGDGKPDIIATNRPDPNGRIRLLSTDPNSTGVQQPSNGSVQPAQLRGEVLEVTLTNPSVVSAQLIMTDGRMSTILAPAQGTIGVNRYDLSSALQRFSSGAYHLRVRVGESFLTIPLIR